MNTIYVVNVYSLDNCGEIEGLTEFYTKTVAEAIELEKIIYQKLVDLQLTEEYYIEVEESEFESLDTFDERKELNYLYERREYLDQEAKEEQERIQKRENEYNSLTDEQKESYDSYMINLFDAIAKSDPIPMQNMFTECKDFHAIAMEEAKNENK